MKRNITTPTRTLLKQSRINKIWTRWIKYGRKRGIQTLEELNEKHTHIFDRRMLQSCAGLTLRSMNIPKKSKNRVMKLTQELYNLGVLEEIIYFASEEMLPRKHLPIKMKEYARVINIIDELNQHFSHLERTEHYFARLNETLLENYGQAPQNH